MMNYANIYNLTDVHVSRFDFETRFWFLYALVKIGTV